MFFGGMGGGGMPFDFDGMGGMPGMGGMGGRQRRDVDTTAYYKRLGVDKSASDSEIKKAYRKLAMKHHPDKGGDPDTFKGITQAYDALSDPDKRRQYDQGGEEAVTGGGERDPGDVFDMFFGGGGGGGGGRKRGAGRRRTKDVEHTLGVTLEQLYNGAVRKIAVNRDVLDRSTGIKTCAECDGRGMRVQVIRMGPMIQQSQAPCGNCSGSGKCYRTKKEREIIEVHVPKGAPHGHKVVISGKADEHPDMDPGDVVFLLNQKDHASFIRRGADLFIKREVTLVEALTGYTIDVEHLDGRKLQVKSKEGEVTTPLAFDPLAEDQETMLWDVFEDAESPGQVVAQAETSDVDTCKKVCEKKGFTAFFIQDGGAFFKQCPRPDILSCKRSKAGSTLYVIKDPSEASTTRLCKAVKGEGMPTARNPFVFGNMFLLLKITFPDSIDEKAAKMLAKALPAPASTVKESPDSEVHFVQDMDPVASREEHKDQDRSAYDEDEAAAGGLGGQRVQCNQQ